MTRYRPTWPVKLDPDVVSAPVSTPAADVAPMRERRTAPDPGANGVTWRETGANVRPNRLPKLTAEQIKSLNEAPDEAEFPAQFPQRCEGIWLQ